MDLKFRISIGFVVAFPFLFYCAPSGPLIFAPYYNECVRLSKNNGSMLYENRCAGYRALFPQELILHSDLPGKEGYTIAFETPLTVTGYGKEIRNAVMVYTIPVAQYTKEELINSITNRDNGTVYTPNNSLPKDSKYIWISKFSGKNTSAPDNFKGLYAICEGYKNYIILTYTATESTYDKNLPLFKVVMNSIQSIPQ